MRRSLLVLCLATASSGVAAALPALLPSAVRIHGGAKSDQDAPAPKKSLVEQIDSTMALQISSLAWFGYALEAAYPKYFSEKYTVAKKYEGNGEFW